MKIGRNDSHMDTDFINEKITVSGAVVFLKTIFIGILLSESWFLSQIISLRLQEYINAGDHEIMAIFVSVILTLLLLTYIWIRDCKEDCKRILKSSRFDIFGLALLGIFISFVVKGIGTGIYISILNKIGFWELILLLAIPFAMGSAFFFRAFQIKFSKRKGTEPFFITDVEGKNKENDLLNYADQATRFAERVFNGGSSDSLVFGIDAPWGIGKSTFVNYCIESWEKEERYKNKVVVYKFNPLRYEDRTNLFEKFIDGLIATLQKGSFSPEIRPLVSKYSRLIKSKATFSFLGLEFELFPGKYTVDDVFDDLEDTLKDSSKKVIIVVDDLDRLSFPAIKDVLFAVKKSFTLSNISYVLCYDTENIVALEKENNDNRYAEKIREFLEKFVNVKISLFLDGDILSKYVKDNFHLALRENLQIGVQTRDQLKEALSVLLEIYKSPYFHAYQPFLGDIRKLKRLINTMMLFEIEKVDFENSDFNKQDLINLLLIYINYPKIFRQIYNSETSGRRGFFTALIPYDDDYPKQNSNSRASEGSYENSNWYKEYVDKLYESQRFLVDQVFDVSKRLPKERRIDSVDELLKKTYACFNGDGLWTGGRNLEEYLNLIVKLAKPQKRGQYKFYLKSKEMVKKGIPIEKALEDPNFAFSEGEGSHEQLWRIIVNSAYEFDSKVGSHLISYLLEHIKDYSLFTNEKIGVGLRDDIDFFLVKLLDVIGWSDPNDEHTENTEENITEIAEWVFGENKHVDIGILETLSKEDRGILGLYDLMAFRLFCSADRGGDIFNLQRSLSKHGNPSVPADINNVANEMREISQKTFSIFKNQYILKHKNIFQLVDKTTLTDFAGKYLDFIEQQIKLGKITEKEKESTIASLKSRVKSFITYQLGNSFISQGVGCGYYDETGATDGKGIAVAINTYLFEECFNPENDTICYEYFLDYLLINFSSVFASRKGRNYIPHIDEFTKVIDHTKLVEYWKTHSTAIKALNLEQKSKVINTGNYTASYAGDLKEVFLVLDKAVEETDS